jgi:hypothetical protein
MFSMSQGLRDMLVARPRVEKQGFAFKGTIEDSEVKTFWVEENVVYDDFIRANLEWSLL